MIFPSYAIIFSVESPGFLVVIILYLPWSITFLQPTVLVIKTGLPMITALIKAPASAHENLCYMLGRPFFMSYKTIPK